MHPQSSARPAHSPPEERKTTRECRSCYGTGEVLGDVEVAYDWFEEVIYACPICKGSGTVPASLYGPRSA